MTIAALFPIKTVKQIPPGSVTLVALSATCQSFSSNKETSAESFERFKKQNVANPGSIVEATETTE